MSRYGARLPIFAFCNEIKTLRRAALFRGVQTVQFDKSDIPSSEINRRVIDFLKEHDIVQDGDFMILSKGDTDELGGTNTMKILQVGKPIL